MKVVDAQTRRQERALGMGMIGSLFGDIQHKPGNVAGFAIAVSLAFLALIFIISYFWPNTNTASPLPSGRLADGAVGRRRCEHGLLDQAGEAMADALGGAAV